MDGSTDPSSDGALRTAYEAALAGDPTKMVNSLFESYALDGLARRLAAKWPYLNKDRDARNEVVAGAVDLLYCEIRNGRRVCEVVGWLWKVADRMAANEYRRRNRESTNQSDDLTVQPQPDRTRFDPQCDWDARRARAIAEARRLLPQLGQHNLQAVMEYILDSIEAGAADVSNVEISDALGLSANTVAQCKLRAFRRLRRIAQQEGLLPDDLPLDDGTLSSDGQLVTEETI